MRYRLMATYRGVPYEAGIGPTGADVVLFAACPPPEELGFEPAPGHWRKRVVRAEVDGLWESRPVGIFRGEPCIVLDDLADRLHIAYLGTDPGRAALLGYWQVDRGVFELLAPREEITGLAEERVERPLRWSSDVLHPGTPPAYPYGSAPWPIQTTAPAPAPGDRAPAPALGEWRPPPPDQAPGVNGTAAEPRAPGLVNGSRPPADPLGDAPGGFPPPPAATPLPATPLPATPLPPDPLVPRPDRPAGAFPEAGDVPLAAGNGPHRDERALRPGINGSGNGTGLPGSPAPEVTRHDLPPESSFPPDGALPSNGTLPTNGTLHPDSGLPLDDLAPWPGTGPQAPRLPRSYERQPPWDTGPGQEVPERRSRSARRQRVTTRAMFSELADLAAIPRHTYAVETEADGAMCLLATATGYEVFLAADGARHEVRTFADEEAAYFYLFGVLVAEAIRNGSLRSG